MTNRSLIVLCCVGVDIAFIRMRCEYAELDNKARSDKVLQDEAETLLLNQGKRGTRRIGKAKVSLIKSGRRDRKKVFGAGKETRKRRIAKAKESLIRFSTKQKQAVQSKLYKANIAAGLAETDV